MRKRATGLRRVSPCVQEHVGECVTHLARRAEHLQVIPIGQNWPGAPKDPVHRARETRANRLHPSPEGTFIVCFHDQVGVVSLYRVMDEPKVAPFAALSKGSLELSHEFHRSQRRNPFAHLERHVTRKYPAKRCTRAVSDARIGSGLSSGAGSSTAVSDPIELELLRCVTHHGVD